ncbi:serine protease FAM111A-like isoform X2 [Boleophthalmus pectinirostris]|uniref:serine protease FAM111A-like isoform X2 n=1 Tax=Boleophthalmus pectinirostris TaxID=150288 RepID=UPI00242BF9F7|nr:serine protease FAM111A-like isoform X2 [Boleophthalmus pectinirostris]
MANTAESQICHSTHSFQWRLGQKKPMTITCGEAGTVKDSLRRSDLFRKNEEKNKLKELVVVRGGRPIPSHFPCILIKPEEQLEVNYVNSKSADDKPVVKSGTRSSEQMVVFNLQTKGGKNITKIVRNPALRSYPEFSVYAYKGEKVKRALKRDGRFLKTIFKKTCALYDLTTNVEMSNLVDDLDDKTFQIIILNKNSPPESQPSSLEDAIDTLEQGNDNALEQGNDNDENNTFIEELCEIPDSKEIRSHLSSLVRDFLNKMSNDQEKDEHQILRVEYGRSQGSVTVETMKRLMSLSNSVCQVRIKGSAVGSGFLLFDSFVLTNFHVIKNVFNQNMQLSEPISVHFSFESFDQATGGHQVQGIVACEYGIDVSGHKCDWALLELNADQVLPPGLLSHFGFIPPSGSICIIGHPHGGVKKVELSWILPNISVQCQVIEKHYNENLTSSERGEVIPFVTPLFARGVAKALSRTRDLTYETCFYFGSSGSPVFDSHCNVVAMHSGGFLYESSSGETQSVIEYGHPLSSILENLIVQLVKRDRLDVLKKILVGFNKHHKTIIHNVKKLVTSRNYTVFQYTANKVNNLNDGTLKMFFDFICESDTPVSMDMELGMMR